MHRSVLPWQYPLVHHGRTAGSNDFTLYGIVTGLQETEYGYQSATEMASITYDASEYGLGTLRIEQDKDFKPLVFERF